MHRTMPSIILYLTVLWLSSTSAQRRGMYYAGSSNETTVAVWVIPAFCLVLAIIILVVCQKRYRNLRRRAMAEILEEIRIGAKYNPLKLELVEAPYPVSEEEEMKIYERNRKWHIDANAQGVNVWYNETFGGDDVCDIKIMKLVQLFMATYCHTLGTDIRCTGCSTKLVNMDTWYRCRYCTNVNLCTQCFERGFTDPSSGHSSSHEMAKFRTDAKCEDCKGYIMDSKMVCKICTGTAYCFGCYSLGKHKNCHTGHYFDMVAPTSFIMLPQQTADDGDSRTTGTEEPTFFSVTPGVNAFGRPTRELPASDVISNPSDAPPSYQECVRY